MGFFKKKQRREENNFDDFPPIGGLMVSRMITDENVKPRFMYREKRIRPEDSGWRIFTGFESDEYNDDSNNIGIYNPSTILKIDPSIKDILLKGIGSVYERTDDNSEWMKVTDFDMEDDYITNHRINDKWQIKINNLFERSIEKDGTLYYTTGDKSVRIISCNSDKNKEELFEEYKQHVEKRDQTKSRTIEIFQFSEKNVSSIGYLIEEKDENKSYNVIFGFSIIDKEVVQVALYFDDKENIEWAITTWKNIELIKL